MPKYRIAPGVNHINGVPVPKNRTTITLTEKEAMYDLAQGRLLPVRVSKSADPVEVDVDGGD